MLFIGAIIGLVAGAVQAAAGAAISTGLSAVGLGGRLAYGTYLNTVRALVLLGRGAGAAGAAGGGLGGFGGGSFSGGGASGSWGGDTANNQTPTPTPTNQAQPPNELPSSGASGTQITSGNDFMEGEYDPLEITSTRGNTTNWNNLGGIGTGIASGVHLMPQVDIIYPKSTNAGKILNTGRVLQTAISPNPAWMQGGHLIPRPGVINTLPQDAIMSGIQASGQISTRNEVEVVSFNEITGTVTLRMITYEGVETVDVPFEQLRQQYVQDKLSEWHNNTWIRATGMWSDTQIDKLKKASPYVVRHLLKRAIAERKIGWRDWVPMYGAYLKYRQGKELNDAILRDEGLMTLGLDAILTLLDVVVFYKAMYKVGNGALQLLRKSSSFTKAELALARKQAYKQHMQRFTREWRNHAYGEFNTETIKSKNGVWKSEELISQGAHNPNGINKTFRVKPGTYTQPNPPVADKPFIAKIEVRYKSGQWIEKDMESTIFPPNWTDQRIKEEICYVYEHTVAKGLGLDPKSRGRDISKYKGTCTAGFDIIIEVDKSGNILNAYPVL